MSMAEAISDSTPVLPVENLAAPLRMLANAQKSFVDSVGGLGNLRSFVDAYVGIVRRASPTIVATANFLDNDQLQASLGTIAATMAEVLKTRRISDVLSEASRLREQLADEDLGNLAGEFLQGHPDIAASIDGLPMIANLAQSDRKLVVWFIGTVVAIYATMGIVM